MLTENIIFLVQSLHLSLTATGTNARGTQRYLSSVSYTRVTACVRFHHAFLPSSSFSFARPFPTVCLISVIDCVERDATRRCPPLIDTSRAAN